MDEPTLYQNLNTLLYSNNSLVILPNTGIDPSQIMSGTQISTVSQNLGSFASGKVSFTDTTEGYILGVNSQGVPEFYIGNATNFLLWDGTNLTVTGSLTADSINIPDNVSANSFHTDSSGNSWWGAVLMVSAPAKILNTGAATFSNMTITGGSIATTTLNKAVQSWTTDITWTATGATQINWSSGHIYMQDFTTYNISSGNTGAMGALT